LAEVVRKNASRLLGREDVRALTEMTKRTHPVVVEEMTPALLSLGQVQKALHALLDEGVPIRDLVRIFEALSLRAKVSTDPDGLVEAARAALGPAIATRYADNGSLSVITEGPQLEPLLAQVSDEYGGRARIVSANKIRSGGLAGFFAKERFELSVEVGDDSASDDAGDTLLDLVDAREDRYESLDEPVSPAA